MSFADRRDAGRRLAAQLTDLQGEQPVVLGLPRGGVPVAAEVATHLGAPLDVLIVRKVGCPWQPELGMGGIGEGDVRVLNDDLIARLGVTEQEVEAVIAREQVELERRVRAYRGDRQAVAVSGRTVVVVDDGLATGFTARTAIEVVRQHGARRVVLAVPVAPPDTVAELELVADGVRCVETPAHFFAIGAWYDDFRQTTDDEVRELLRHASAETADAGAAERQADLSREVEVVAGPVRLPGTLDTPEGTLGAVIFAHGSGSSRFSPRNAAVAAHLNEAGLTTLLLDLLTPTEADDRRNVFDVVRLAERLRHATRWLEQQAEAEGLAIGYFGASTGAAAALHAAADLGSDIGAVVSRGGRPDLAGARLGEVTAPTLLIVGGRDDVVLRLNRHAQQQLQCESRLEVVPGAGHLFEEPGALAAVADLAAQWFRTHLAPLSHTGRLRGNRRRSRAAR